MERLTAREPDGIVVDVVEQDCSWNLAVSNAICKLADYEDAEEQGRLIEFPVAIGGHLWHVEAYPPSITETVVRGLFTDGKNLFAHAQESGNGSTQTYILSGLGNWLFTDKEQAETKLKELK